MQAGMKVGNEVVRFLQSLAPGVHRQLSSETPDLVRLTALSEQSGSDETAGPHSESPIPTEVTSISFA